MNTTKAKLTGALTVGAIFFGAFMFMSAYYTIETGTVGVLSTFGKYDPEEKAPGLHLKVPIFQSIKIFDVKMQTVNYNGPRDEPDFVGVINKPSIEVLDDKNLRIGLDLTVQYTPDPSRADEILATFGFNYFEKKLNAIIRTIVRDAASKYAAENIATERQSLGRSIKLELAKSFESLPFNLNEVALRNIVLPRIVTEKIEQVQQAKQEEQRLAMVKKQIEQEQLIKETQAQTKLIEVTTAAKAEAEKRKIEADAQAYKIKIEAEAVAKANELIAKSLTPDLVTYKGLEVWDGVMPQTLMGSEGGVSALISVPQK